MMNKAIISLRSTHVSSTLQFIPFRGKRKGLARRIRLLVRPYRIAANEENDYNESIASLMNIE
jgi:hypothetical protein